MRFKLDQEASAQVVALMVAGAIFMAAIGAVLLASSGAGSDRSSADAAAQDIEADGLADLLIGSAGVGWAAGPDQLGRLGLAAANGSGLQQSSIDALRGALMASSANGKVDYADAQRSLGLDPAGAQDFHIRIYPVGLQSTYDASLSGLRVAYVADFLSLASVTVPLGTPTSLLAAQANAQLNLSMAPTTANERAALQSLGVDFTDRIFITTAAPTIKVDMPLLLPDTPILTVLGVPLLEGDVYPDIKVYLDNVFAPRLSEYDILVVGSGVDHSSMTANVVKDGVRDWVLAGGTLVVLGSASQSYQWLQPLFHTGVATVNGAASAPDVAHPLLKEPNELAWTSYDSHGRGWDIKSQGSGAHYDDFSHVIVQGGEDVLAISKDGAFGDGRIVLTTYMPREIAGTLGQPEAENFFENIALFTDRSNLYLDYGPTAPGDTPVSVAVRQSWLYDEVLGQVPVRIEIATWA